MRKQKKQLLGMLILLVVLAAAYAGVRAYNDKQEEKEAEGTITVTDFTSDEVTRFSYTLDGEEYSYTKDGESWTWDGNIALDLQESMVKTMLNAVAGLTASEEMTEYEALSDYGLEEPSAAISVTTDAGTTILYVGNKNAITGTYYVKCSNSDSVYLISKNLSSTFSKLPEDMVVVEETEEVTEEVTEKITEEVTETTGTEEAMGTEEAAGTEE